MGLIPSRIITSTDCNLETFSLLWLDALVDTTEENNETQVTLRTAINQLKTFKDSKRCEEYISSMPKDDRIVLIVSGSLGRELVPKIHSLEQLLSIYVYCQDQYTNEQWSSQFPKVKAVITNLQDLIRQIQFDQAKRQHYRTYESLPISIFDPNIIHEKLTTDLQGNYVNSQLLINCLLQMKSKATDKNELVSTSKQIYKNNQAELMTINEFENEYSSNRAIWWYTRDSFLSRILNKALRTQNIDVLFLFQFFIADIRQQLERLRCASQIKAYRSQLMLHDELKKLKNSVGQFISINTFFSTTRNYNLALSYLENIDGLERVLFEIDADPRLDGVKPFADIKSHSYDKEDAIFFMLGSIFQINSISRLGSDFWIIRLKLCSDSSQQLNSIDDRKFLSFGHVLRTMGKVDEAEIYYKRLIDELPNHPDLAHFCQALGDVLNEKGEYDASLRRYNQSLDTNIKTLGEKHPHIASNYNSIGEIYRKKNDYKKAIDSYEKALKILGDNPVGKSLAKQAVCYNNIGIVYQEQQKYQDALVFYMKAFHIRKDHFPSDETSLGMSFNNVGNAYYFLDLYEDALYHYKMALQIYKKTLPPQHPKFASTYNNIAAIYDDQGNLKDALWFYREAAKIYGTMFPSTHPNVIKIEENIQRISSKLK